MMRPFIRILSPYEAQHSGFDARQKMYCVKEEEGGLLRKYSNNVKHHHATISALSFCLVFVYIFFFALLHSSRWPCAVLSVFFRTFFSITLLKKKNDTILSHNNQVHSWCNKHLFVAKFIPIHWMLRANHHLHFLLRWKLIGHRVMHGILHMNLVFSCESNWMRLEIQTHVEQLNIALINSDESNHFHLNQISFLGLQYFPLMFIIIDFRINHRCS